MTRDELMKLADRVEALTGPDRGVDADIELATCNWSSEHHEAWWRHQEAGESANPLLVEPVPPQWFTSSLDAALTLVPEGWEWMAGHGRKPMAYVHNGQSAFVGIGTRPNPARRWFEVSAAAPALALIGCALRAHATTLGD